MYTWGLVVCHILLHKTMHLRYCLPKGTWYKYNIITSYMPFRYSDPQVPHEHILSPKHKKLKFVQILHQYLIFPRQLLQVFIWVHHDPFSTLSIVTLRKVIQKRQHGNGYVLQIHSCTHILLISKIFDMVSTLVLCVTF